VGSGGHGTDAGGNGSARLLVNVRVLCTYSLFRARRPVIQAMRPPFFPFDI
jgi:hypothetical protein